MAYNAPGFALDRLKNLDCYEYQHWENSIKVTALGIFKLNGDKTANPDKLSAKKQWQEALKKRNASAVKSDSALNPPIALQVVK